MSEFEFTQEELQLPPKKYECKYNFLIDFTPEIYCVFKFLDLDHTADVQ